MEDTSQPITGICIITKPASVPTGYSCIRKVYDEPSRDASLIPEAFLDRKERFLCITRAQPPAGNKAYAVEDIKLINERDNPAAHYTALTHTQDTHEKGTTRRTICVKFVERQAGMKCVCDILFIYRSKRPPQSYTLIGEINGFQMCIKEGIVPSIRLPVAAPTSNLYPNPFNYQRQQSTNPIEYTQINSSSKKSDEKEILDGIPFSINPKYLSSLRNGVNDPSGLDSLHVLSPSELEENFNYDFKLERVWFQSL